MIMKNILTRYERNLIIRSLIQLVPLGIGSAVDTGISSTLTRIREERAKTFFDELGAGNIELTKEVIDSEDFLNCYFSTVKAALNTRRREKIRVFCQLLKGALASNIVNDVDEYEEFLSVLDELSFREFRIVSALEEHEAKYPLLQGDEKRTLAEDISIEAYDEAWKEFKEWLYTQLNIPKDEADSILRRLGRTGLVKRVLNVTTSGEKVQVFIMDHEERVVLTARGKRFLQIIRSHDKA